MRASEGSCKESFGHRVTGTASPHKLEQNPLPWPWFCGLQKQRGVASLSKVAPRAQEVGSGIDFPVLGCSKSGGWVTLQAPRLGLEDPPSLVPPACSAGPLLKAVQGEHRERPCLQPSDPRPESRRSFLDRHSFRSGPGVEDPSAPRPRKLCTCALANNSGHEAP